MPAFVIEASDIFNLEKSKSTASAKEARESGAIRSRQPQEAELAGKEKAKEQAPPEIQEAPPASLRGDRGQASGNWKPSGKRGA